MNFDRNHNCNKRLSFTTNQEQIGCILMFLFYITLRKKCFSWNVFFWVNFDCYSIKITAAKDFLLQPRADGTRRKLAVSWCFFFYITLRKKCFNWNVFFCSQFWLLVEIIIANKIRIGIGFTLQYSLIQKNGYTFSTVYCTQLPGKVWFIKIRTTHYM